EPVALAAAMPDHLAPLALVRSLDHPREVMQVETSTLQHAAQCASRSNNLAVLVGAKQAEQLADRRRDGDGCGRHVARSSSADVHRNPQVRGANFKTRRSALTASMPFSARRRMMKVGLDASGRCRRDVDAVMGAVLREEPMVVF